MPPRSRRPCQAGGGLGQRAAASLGVSRGNIRQDGEVDRRDNSIHSGCSSSLRVEAPAGRPPALPSGLGGAAADPDRLPGRFAVTLPLLQKAVIFIIIIIISACPLPITKPSGPILQRNGPRCCRGRRSRRPARRGDGGAGVEGGRGQSSPRKRGDGWLLRGAKMDFD